ncbi:MAG: DNA helicase UvrD [Deltaproteobacteria bacterium]|nr:DNA helicase UvrD [Deltaproteobacteria bacterium]
MRFLADLHLHSPASRSTSPAMTLENLHLWAQLKGVTLLGTGDFTHPVRLAEIRKKLAPAEPGLYRLKKPFINDGEVPQRCRRKIRFLLSAEISTIYSREGRTRKVHHLLLARDLSSVARINRALARIGNLESDGRPILGLDSRDLLRIVLESHPENILIPAHAWTPHFSVFGAFSSFSSLEECYGEPASQIPAIETGLSSDPPMNRRLTQLDGIRLISNSDAHSLPKLMREATIFETGLSYPAVREALRGGWEKGLGGTVEFFPEEGKYHFDGHRKCGICLSPAETRKHKGLCPVCGKRLTLGVLHRVEELADRDHPAGPADGTGFQSLIPLAEILSGILCVGVGSKRVDREYRRLLSVFGDEYTVLTKTSLAALAEEGSSLLAEAVGRVREGRVEIEPGYDGVYGRIGIGV